MTTLRFPQFYRLGAKPASVVDAGDAVFYRSTASDAATMKARSEMLT